MEDGNLKESQNQHSAGPGLARNQTDLETGGCKVSATGVPVVTPSYLLLVTNHSRDLVTQWCLGFFFNFSWFDMLTGGSSDLAWAQLRQTWHGWTSLQGVLHPGLLNSMVVSGFQEGQPQSAGFYQVSICVMFSDVLLVKSNHCGWVLLWEGTT